MNSYGPFGEPGAGGVGLDQGRIRYTGQMYLPEAGLYHYKARAYSHKWGRFLQTDPAGSADDLNPYAYVGNDPVNLVDPTGMFADSARKTANILGTSQVHGTLDAIGVFDPTGIADGLNAGLYASKGDWVNAGISAAGILPVIGDAAKGLKYGNKALKAAESAASNVASAPKLAAQLRLESARSPFTSSGQLTPQAIQDSRMIIPNSQIGNPKVPPGYNKYSTPTYQSPSGDFQTHFYMDPKTGKVLYDLDYKSKFN